MSPEEFSSTFEVDERVIDGDLLVLRSNDKSDALPSKTDFLQAMFWKGRLVKFSWVSDNFTGDLFGKEGQEAYAKLASTLSQKLGAGEETTITGRELWDEPDEFYQCLAYDGCGVWVTFWVNSSVGNNIAVLQLNGLDRGEGYLRYVVEHPDWYKYSDDRASGDASKF